MRRRHKLLAAASLLAPAACSQPTPAAHRGATTSTTPHVDAGPDATAAPREAATSTEPATESAAAESPTAAAGPTTTVTVTMPATTRAPRTTTTFVLPEQVEEPDEFDARDAATARVSWYGDESGTHTANGDRYDPSGLTFAHLSMPFGTRVRFCGPLGCVVATCTDRGPAQWTGKTFDLSRGAFALVAPLSAGVATVTWERVG